MKDDSDDSILKLTKPPAFDVFYEEVAMKKQINVKCEESLRTALDKAAKDLRMDPADLVRHVMKNVLITLALDGDITISEVTDETRELIKKKLAS